MIDFFLPSSFLNLTDDTMVLLLPIIDEDKTRVLYLSELLSNISLLFFFPFHIVLILFNRYAIWYVVLYALKNNNKLSFST